jgi:uncharacterized glyoxalase superfamily protein PhnB
MKRVTGIGGIFFTAKNPVALRAWYKQHLGIDVQEWGGTAFTWTDAAGNPTNGTTVWSIGAADGEHFAPSKSTFMVNYRVEDLAALLQSLRDEGCNVLEKTDDSEYGKFGWVMGTKADLKVGDLIGPIEELTTVRPKVCLTYRCSLSSHVARAHRPISRH